MPEQWAHDLERAGERIGTTVEARCRWVLEHLIPHDPSQLSTSERATLRENLMALARGLFGQVPPMVTRASYSLGDPVWTDDPALRELWLRIGALARAHQSPVPLPDTKFTLSRRADPKYVVLERTLQISDFGPLVLHRIVDLLTACTRLRECPECHNLFVARRRQERHPKCARARRDAKRPSRQKKGR